MNSRYQDLTAGENYVVIGIKADTLQILNDQVLRSAHACDVTATEAAQSIGIK